MRIEEITIQNFLGMPDFRHPLTAPLLFVAGPNGAGKSSLQDALRFALTGDPPRGVTKIGDRPMLITDGAAAGFARVVIDGFDLRRNIGSGKVTGDAPQIPDAMRFCLDAPKFASMAEADRRRWLFDLAQVQVKREEIGQQLLAAGIAEGIVERVLPLLRDGFPAAAAFAKEQATDARADWKAITGEPYGSKKAETWKAEPPENVPLIAEVEETRALVAAAEAKVQAATEAKGRVGASVTAERRAELEEAAGRIEDLTGALSDAEDAVVIAKQEREALNTGPGGDRHICPECEAKLVLVDGKLQPAPAGKPPSQAAINGAQQKLAGATRDRDVVRNALRAAEVARATLDELPEPPSAEDIAAAASLDQCRDGLFVHRNTLKVLENGRNLAEAAHGKTGHAMEVHKNVAAWIAAEHELGPDGIPATLLSRALDPINDALAQQATAAGFRPARVERDLSLTYAGRAYALCSESERWRADALFAVVVAILSGVRLVTLDRFDVLDPESRGEALDWLENLGGDADSPALIDTIIVTATLKAKPDLGEGIDVVWLEGKPATLQAAA
jgi:hypothetical protein